MLSDNEAAAASLAASAKPQKRRLLDPAAVFSPAVKSQRRPAAAPPLPVGMMPHPAAAAHKRHTQQKHTAQSAKLLQGLAASFAHRL